MTFSHPLAGAAKVWPAKVNGDQTSRILVVVTTLELDPGSKRYNEELVERLSGAAEDYVGETPDVDGFIIATRAREWVESKA